MAHESESLLSIFCYGPDQEISKSAELFFEESHVLLHFIATPFSLAKKMDQTLAGLLESIGNPETAIVNYAQSVETYKRPAIDLLHAQLINLFLNYLVDIYCEVKKIQLESAEQELAIQNILDGSRLGFKQLNLQFTKELGLDICPSIDKLRSLKEAIEFRNLYVHNHAIVNQTYLRRIPSSHYKLGEIIHSHNKGWTDLVAELVLNLDNQLLNQNPNLQTSRFNKSKLCHLLGVY